MRCSSCEPLLDAHLESLLRPRRAREVAEHLRECVNCEALMRELRVIDALLTTARAPGSVTSDFTAAVVLATRGTRPHAHRRVPLWVPLLAYLAIAWTLAAVAASRLNEFTQLFAAFAESGQRGLAALGAVIRAFAPATPLAAATVTGVLLLDLLLLGAIVYAYRRLRPMIAIYLAREPRP